MINDATIEYMIAPAIKNLAMDFLTNIRKENPSEDINIENINEGCCADFATVIWERFQVLGVEITNDEELGAEDYTHTFLSFGGKYFDAETPYGVADWHLLPIFVRNAAINTE